MSAEDCIEAKVFEDLRASVGDDFVRELIDTYCMETPRLLADLEAALARGDAGSFTRQAHSIKSSSAAFGANDLAARARALEMMGRSGDLSDANGPLCALLAAYRAVETRLQEWRHAA